MPPSINQRRFSADLEKSDLDQSNNNEEIEKPEIKFAKSASNNFNLGAITLVGKFGAHRQKDDGDEGVSEDLDEPAERLNIQGQIIEVPDENLESSRKLPDLNILSAPYN